MYNINCCALWCKAHLSVLYEQSMIRDTKPDFMLHAVTRLWTVFTVRMDCSTSHRTVNDWLLSVNVVVTTCQQFMVVSVCVWIVRAALTSSFVSSALLFSVLQFNTGLPLKALLLCWGPYVLMCIYACFENVNLVPPKLRMVRKQTSSKSFPGLINHVFVNPPDTAGAGQDVSDLPRRAVRLR